MIWWIQNLETNRKCSFQISTFFKTKKINSVFPKSRTHFENTKILVVDQNLNNNSLELSMSPVIIKTFIMWYPLKFNLNSVSKRKWQKFIQKFYLWKVQETIYFLPVFYLIMCLMKAPKNFEKIPILKIWQLVSFWGVKTHFGFLPLKWCIFKHGIFLFSPILPL